MALKIMIITYKEICDFNAFRIFLVIVTILDLVKKIEVLI